MDNIRLYLNNILVEMDDNNIFYNFVKEDLLSPAAVKNSFSKTVTIKGSPNNIKIFDNVEVLERTQGTLDFNPSKKIDFKIFSDGDIIESGYAKLDNIVNEEGDIVFNVTLYGGLFSFFYSLMYKDSNEDEDAKKTLGDLSYESDLSFTINKDVVNNAWKTLKDGAMSEEDIKYETINFAAAYEGIPSNIDADKVLINFNEMPDTTFKSNVIKDNILYKGFAGYGLGTMAEEHTADEMREYRSYLMRPVINVRKVLESCFKPENNGGYNVVLDPVFFNEDNDYWTKTWMTLPLLSDIDFSGNAETDCVCSLGSMKTTGSTSARTGYKEERVVSISDRGAYKVYNATMKVKVKTTPYDVYGRIRQEDISLSYFDDSQNQSQSVIVLQLVAYDKLGNIIAGGDALNLASGTGPDGTILHSYRLWNYELPWGKSYYQSNGKFTKEDNEWVWKDAANADLVLNITNVPADAEVKLIAWKLGAGVGTGKRYDFGQPLYPDNMYVWQSKYPLGIVNLDVEILSQSVTLNTDDGVRTGSEISQNRLLDTEYSPCDFLLSYTKMFGLMYYKEPDTKTIHIMTRNAFYDYTGYNSIDNIIDRGQTIEINPLAFEHKWYRWGQEQSEGLFSTNYQNTYNIDYGQQRINTGYEFDNETEEVLEGNIFKNAVQALEKSKTFGIVEGDTDKKPWVIYGVEYDLYKDGKLDEEKKETVEIKSTTPFGNIIQFKDGYYDQFDKVQFRDDNNNGIDGNNVLLFLNGIGNTGSVNYFITDDLVYMDDLNNTKTWIHTVSEYDIQGNKIAHRINDIPLFSRYIVGRATGKIMKSLDFGQPKQIYIPEITTNEQSTIYYQYWKNYIADLYDVNTRVVSLDVLKDWSIADFRKFWYFDNCIWSLNKVNDYIIGSNSTTNVEFVKVCDRDRYKIEGNTEKPQISIEASAYNIEGSGSTVNLDIIVPEDANWYLTMPDFISMTGTGTGPATIEMVVPSNEGKSRTFNIGLVTDYGEEVATFNQSSSSFRLEADSTVIPNAGATVPLTVIAPNNFPWILSANIDDIEWSIDRGMGSTQVEFTVPKLKGEAREFVITLSSPIDSTSLTFTQLGTVVYLEVQGSKTRNIGPQYGNYTVKVRYNGSGEVSQRISSGSDWCQYYLYSKETFDDYDEYTFRYTMYANETSDNRSVAITFFDGSISDTCTFTQVAQLTVDVVTLISGDSTTPIGNVDSHTIVMTGPNLKFSVVVTVNGLSSYDWPDKLYVICGQGSKSPGDTNFESTSYDSQAPTMRRYYFDYPSGNSILDKFASPIRDGAIMQCRMNFPNTSIANNTLNFVFRGDI